MFDRSFYIVVCATDEGGLLTLHMFVVGGLVRSLPRSMRLITTPSWTLFVALLRCSVPVLIRYQKHPGFGYSSNFFKSDRKGSIGPNSVRIGG